MSIRYMRISYLDLEILELYHFMNRCYCFRLGLIVKELGLYTRLILCWIGSWLWFTIYIFIWTIIKLDIPYLVINQLRMYSSIWGDIRYDLTLLKDYDDWIGTWTYSELDCDLDWTWVIDDIGFTFFIIAWSALR